jgi:core binding factor beta subunit
MNELVQRLSVGEHAVTVGGSKPSLEDLKWRIEDIGYVFIKFTETQGGTDLGVRVDKNAINLSGANFDQRTGSVHIEGTLTLNYVSVRCIADIDLATLNGTGHLTILEKAHTS